MGALMLWSNTAVHPIAPPYPSSIASTSEPVAAPRAALVSRFIEPPLVYQRRHPAPTLAPSRVGSSVYHPVAVARDTHSTHPMVTRHATGVTKPMDRLQLSVVAAPPTLSPVPTSVRSVLADPHWRRYGGVQDPVV
jgi:hypothetical protein